jgi:hypothetical protein
MVTKTREVASDLYQLYLPLPMRPNISERVLAEKRR